MSDQLSIQRAASFKQSAVKLRAFAERQEARAPGRMDHITGPALAAAALAEQASAAYAAGDKEAAKEARDKYAELILRHSLNGFD